MFESLKDISPTQIKNDVLSGLTVSLALVPEAVAFAFVAGVHPLVGLYAAFLVGLITSLFGRPGMISGATGAMAVVMVSLVAQHGVEYLFAAVVLTGILQLAAGAFGLGKFIRIVPEPVMMGFVNGLAIVIFLAQLSQFKTPDASGALQWMQGNELTLMLGLVVLTMAIIHFLPKFTKAIPSSLAAILTVSLLVIFGGLPTRTVGDVASISGGFPQFHIPEVAFNLETLKIIFPYSLILAAVGLIESLLTLTVIDEMTETKGESNRECFAQGLANLVTGFFGGMGGCAMIGQSMININSGGRTRISGITAALGLLSFILFASSLIEQVPLAALTGVMMMVVIGTFEWSSLRVIRRVPFSDALVIVVVSVVTVFTDLAIAVVVGVIISALVFSWKYSHQITATEYNNEKGEKVYEIHGAIFFGSASIFSGLFNIPTDPEIVNVDFKYARVCDHSALEAVNSLTEKYKRVGKELHVFNLSGECSALLDKAGDLVTISRLDETKA